MDLVELETDDANADSTVVDAGAVEVAGIAAVAEFHLYKPVQVSGVVVGASVYLGSPFFSLQLSPVFDWRVEMRQRRQQL